MSGHGIAILNDFLSLPPPPAAPLPPPAPTPLPTIMYVALVICVLSLRQNASDKC